MALADAHEPDGAGQRPALPAAPTAATVAWARVSNSGTVKLVAASHAMAPTVKAPVPRRYTPRSKPGLGIGPGRHAVEAVGPGGVAAVGVVVLDHDGGLAGQERRHGLGEALDDDDRHPAAGLEAVRDVDQQVVQGRRPDLGGDVGHDEVEAVAGIEVVVAERGPHLDPVGEAVVLGAGRGALERQGVAIDGHARSGTDRRPPATGRAGRSRSRRRGTRPPLGRRRASAGGRRCRGRRRRR